MISVFHEKNCGSSFLNKIIVCADTIGNKIHKQIGQQVTIDEMAALIAEFYKILSSKLHLKISELQSENFS